MTDIVFLDTETLGLDPDAPVWEFAAVRRVEDPATVAGWSSLRYGPHGPEIDVHFTIHHDPTGWLADFPEEFAADYHGRYDATVAWCEIAAAREIYAITKDAHIIGAVPSFDTERLAKLLRRNGIEPGWHYHLVDVENIVVGYLAAKGQLLPPPWKSDQLSAAVGVDPATFERHTAMGGVRWAIAQWDAVMGGAA